MNLRRLTSLLAAVLLVALSVTAVAVAAKPGTWTDSKRKLEFGIAKDKKHFEYLDWTCKKDATVATGFRTGKVPKVHSNRRFKFTVAATVLKGGLPTKDVKVTMKGRFVKRNGKPRAVGTIRSGYCGKKAKSFKAKWSPSQG